SGGREQVRGRTVVGERRARRVGELAQPLRVPQPRLFRLERERFAGRRTDRLDLAHLISDEVDLALAVTRRLGQRRERPASLEQALVRLSVPTCTMHLRLAGGTIEEFGLRRAIQQPQRAVLPVDL